VLGALQDRRVPTCAGMVAVRLAPGGGLRGDGRGGLVAQRAFAGMVRLELATARVATGAAGLWRVDRLRRRAAVAGLATAAVASLTASGSKLFGLFWPG